MGTVTRRLGIWAHSRKLLGRIVALEKGLFGLGSAAVKAEKKTSAAPPSATPPSATPCSTSSRTKATQSPPQKAATSTKESAAPAAVECAICLCAIDTKKELAKLACGHAFHGACLNAQVDAGPPGPHISASHLRCALCRSSMRQSKETPTWKGVLKWGEKVTKARERAEAARLTARVALKADAKMAASAKAEMAKRGKGADLLDVMAVFICSKCEKMTCVGMHSCARALNIEAKSLVCAGCSWETMAGDHKCRKHGIRSAMFKCDSCCNVATYDCYTNHYCERCHAQAHQPKSFPCPGPDKCPLGIPHPKNCSAVHSEGLVKPFVIGCMACAGFDVQNDSTNREWEF